ncbi:sigma 54-interacting transcriptional regulator, partial [Pseudomonas aeruginosa]
CAAIPESLIESELFGYVGGAFTGAAAKGMRGLLQQADGGTLFLDEIGDMPLGLQTRLLRVLAEGEVAPLGAARRQAVD